MFDIVEGAHQVMVIDQVKLFAPYHDRDRPYAQVIVQFARALFQFLAHAPGTDSNFRLADRELRR